MAYFHVCPRCGSNLDPGEICDCEVNQEEPNKRSERKEAQHGNYVATAGRAFSRSRNTAVGMG